MTTQGIGWVTRSIELARLPALNSIEQPGFGFRILAGAQYVKAVVPVQARSSRSGDLPEFGELFDGATFACPGGFTSLQFLAVEDIPASGIARVAVKVFTLPNVVATDTSGIEAKSSIRLLNSDLHTDFGGTQHLVVPPTSQLLVHDDAAMGYQQNAPPSLAGTHRSRTLGDEYRPWWPSSELFFHGFVAIPAAWAADVVVTAVAYLIDGNGARNVVPYYSWDNAETLAATYAGLYTPGGTVLDTVIRLGGKAALSNPVPYPVNGCRIYIENANLVAVNVVGILAVRSA